MIIFTYSNLYIIIKNYPYLYSKNSFRIKKLKILRKKYIFEIKFKKF